MLSHLRPSYMSREGLLQDLRFGVRVLWKSPGLSACAAILIALVIGGNTMIYSLVHTTLTRPAAGVTASNLYYLAVAESPGEPFHAYADYRDYAGQTTSLTPLVAFAPERITLRTGSGSHAIFGSYVTTNYFQALGVRPLIGRVLHEADDRPERSGLVAVISHRIWQERFAGEPNVVGRTVFLNRIAATVIGVAAPGFHGADVAIHDDVWFPAQSYFRLRGDERALSARAESERAEVLILGQLAAGASRERAEAEVASVSARLTGAFPRSHSNKTATLIPYTASANSGIAQVGGRFLAIFSVITVLTLLIVCANVANLMLSRAFVRQREIAVRQSLGASRVRILRMFIAESLAVALVAWMLASLAAVWTSRGIAWLLFGGDSPQGLQSNYFAIDFTPDWRVFAYAMLLAIVATLAVAIVPGVLAGRRQPAADLQAAAYSLTPKRTKLARLLVVTQLAFSVLLLTGAGLAYRSLSIIETGDVQFDRRNLLLVAANPSLIVTSPEAHSALLETLRQRLAAIPGVSAVSYIRVPPPFTMGVEPARASITQEPVVARINYVGPEYLRTLGLRPIAGRELSSSDRGGSRRVAVINARLAEELWPRQSAIGQTLLIGESNERFDVAGVTPNALFTGVHRNARSNFVFFAEQQDSTRPIGQAGLLGSGETTFYVKHAGSLSAAAINTAMMEVDADIPVRHVRTMDAQLESIGGTTRTITMLLTLFALVSITIASIGLYAAVAFDTKRRTRELGVRIALGASRQRILYGVLRDGALLTAVGLVVGFALSAAAGTVLGNVLYGLTPTDPRTYLGVFTVLGVASLVACYIPARRAAHVDPQVSLRQE